MTLSRFLHFPAILLLGASLTVWPVLAQTADNAEPAPLNGKVVEDIVARVNDQIITQSDYDRAQQQVVAEAKQQATTPQDLEDRQKNLLRELIDQQLLLSKGKDLGITGETELVHRLDDIRKQNHLDSMEALEKAAESQGVSYEDFKANIRNNIVTQQVVQNEVGRHLSITHAELENYYKAHESEFAQPESVRLSEILVPTPESADAAQLAATQASAEALEAKLKAGAKFEELAKTSSSGPTAAQGGDLGVFRRGMLAKELEDRTFSLKAGEFTQPIRTKQGWIILEVTEHTEGGDAGFKKVEPQVEQAVYLEHMQPALRQYLTKLREAAYIDIQPGFVDTGASPNEIHPTYSAYEPPGPKKKKKFARTRFRGRARSSASPAPAESAQTPVTVAPSPAKAPAAGTQVAAKNEQRVQKPGKKEKIRFGQAPRESLPPAQNEAAATESVATESSAPSAGAVNPEVHDLDPGDAIGGETSAPSKEVKTRYSDRAKVHKVKHKKQTASTDTGGPPPPSQKELADQKVQTAPLGLAGPPVKKKKTKEPKTRYSGTKKAPEPTPQPYMGNQQQPAAGIPPAGAQPAGPSPAPQATDGTPQ